MIFFFKAYFEMVIEAPGLQTKVRGFLKDTTKNYTDILEEIHADYWAKKTGEDIRGVLGEIATSIALVRRGTVDKDKTKREADIERAWKYVPFPDNLGPTEFYSLMKKWYSVLSNPLSTYTTENKTFVANFKFNCEL